MSPYLLERCILIDCRQEVEELRYEKEYLKWQLSHALERYDWLTCSYSVAPSSESPPSLFGPVCRQASETQDDQHVKAKHASIYPTEEDVSAFDGCIAFKPICVSELNAVIFNDVCPLNRYLGNSHPLGFS